MVVHAVAALMRKHFLRRKRAEVAVVVVTEHQRHALELGVAHQSRGCLVAVEIRLNLFIKRKHSWNFIKVLVDVLFNQSVLRFQNSSKQVNVVRKRCFAAENRGIGFATHADRDHIFELSASLKAVLPEPGDALFVRIEIPSVAVNGALAAHVAVLFALAAARLVM